MKSSLKWAVVLLAFSLTPETALAGKKNWKYVPPEGDALSKQIAGTYNRKSTKRYAKVSGGRDCGARDFADADAINNITPIVGTIIDVAGGAGIASAVLGIGGGFASSSASRAGEMKRWNCFERDVKSQVAGIGKQMDLRLNQQDTIIADTRAGVIAAHEKIAVLAEENQKLRELLAERQSARPGVHSGMPQAKPPTEFCGTCGMAPTSPKVDNKPAPIKPPGTGITEEAKILSEKRPGEWFATQPATKPPARSTLLPAVHVINAGAR